MLSSEYFYNRIAEKDKRIAELEFKLTAISSLEEQLKVAARAIEILVEALEDKND